MSKTTGCINLAMVVKTGLVKVMSYEQACIVARKAGTSLQYYTKGRSDLFKASGFLANVVSFSTTNGRAVGYLLTPVGKAGAHWVDALAVFGPAYNIGDVVEVGTSPNPEKPPVRRVFIGYGFDHEFCPVVMTYDDDDSLDLLDNANAATVVLEDAEIYDYVFPSGDLVKPTSPVYTVKAFRDSVEVAPSLVPADVWANLRNS